MNLYLFVLSELGQRCIITVESISMSRVSMEIGKINSQIIRQKNNSLCIHDSFHINNRQGLKHNITT
jgi:hypothetical protein